MRGSEVSSVTNFDLAIFAHNEAKNISTLINDLAQQDIFGLENLDTRILILANGCSDNTVDLATKTIAELSKPFAEKISVVELTAGGKSRTGHRFIHEISRQNADVLGFMDADIRLPSKNSLRRMIEEITSRPELEVFNSRPVKDVNYYKLKVGLIGQVIAAGAGGLTDWRKSICGQLFVVRGPKIRKIGLPVGLPVEDGFFRAMILTDLLSRPEDLSRIDGDPDIFHVYQSIDKISELLKHQTRIVIGSAINSVLFAKIRREAPDESMAHSLLMTAAADEAWLSRVLAEELPRKPYGYVPAKFLTNRWHRYRAQKKTSLRSGAILLAGLTMDAIVWLRATYKMSRGVGVGHW